MAANVPFSTTFDVTMISILHKHPSMATEEIKPATVAIGSLKKYFCGAVAIDRPVPAFHTNLVCLWSSAHSLLMRLASSPEAMPMRRIVVAQVSGVKRRRPGGLVKQ